VPKQYISETFDIFFIYKEMHTRTHIQSTDNILQCEPWPSHQQVVCWRTVT
jgi:hypothetical protein